MLHGERSWKQLVRSYANGLVKSVQLPTVGILVNFDAFGWFDGCISYLGAQLTLRVKL